MEASTLLERLASTRTPEPEKEGALQNLMRSDDREALLDAAVDVIESSGSGLLSGRRWPLPLPSRRAKLGAYSRLLESLLDEEPGSGSRFQQGDRALRRRLLLVLLRQLRSVRGVWALEGEATRRRRLSANMDEMLRRTPVGLETPAYEVEAKRQAWEVRRYGEFSVATTARERAVSEDGIKLGNPTMRSAGGFQALAGYLFGRNQQEEKMAMTTPVLSSGGEMAFVLPSRYWSEEGEGGAAPPTPMDDSGVRVVRKGGGVLDESESLACLWFGGFAGPKDVATRKAELCELVAADDEWELAASGSEGGEAAGAEEPVLLQYNDPFTPSWKRRNEVAVPVRRKAAA
jgi:hypothetical protein